MNNIKFEDVRAKYVQAIGVMKDNQEFVLNQPSSLNAPWLNYETLSRWTFGSTHEFSRDYHEMFKAVENPTVQQSKLMKDNSIELRDKVKYMQEYLKLKFPKMALKQGEIK